MQIVEEGHLLIWSGIKQEQIGVARVPCLIHKDLSQNIQKWEEILERLLKIQLKRKNQEKNKRTGNIRT